MHVALSTRHKLPVRGLAPETVDIDDVLTDSGDRDLEKALALGRFEEDPLFLGQSMANPAIANPTARRFPATETFDVVLVGLGHVRNLKAEVGKRKWA
jgi:hypothetical protein